MIKLLVSVVAGVLFVVLLVEMFTSMEAVNNATMARAGVYAPAAR